MDLIFEFLAELILEGSIELGLNKKTPKWLRYPLLLFITLVYGFVLFIIFFCAIKSFKENILISLLLILFGLFFIIMTIYQVTKRLKKEKQD